MNCTMECYWALCRSKGVCHVGRKSRCVYVSGTTGITELYREMLVTTIYLNTKCSYSGTAVPQMSAFKMFIYTLRYVSEEFLDIQVYLESYHMHSRYVCRFAGRSRVL